MKFAIKYLTIIVPLVIITSAIGSNIAFADCTENAGGSNCLVGVACYTPNQYPYDYCCSTSSECSALPTPTIRPPSPTPQPTTPPTPQAYTTTIPSQNRCTGRPVRDCVQDPSCIWANNSCSANAASSSSGSLGSFSQFINDFNHVIGIDSKVSSLSGIINSLLPYLLTIAGLILFGMLIMGGFEFLTAATDPKQAEKGQQRITTAVIGFLIIFTAYWITQIVEIILGIKILGK